MNRIMATKAMFTARPRTSRHRATPTPDRFGNRYVVRLRRYCSSAEPGA